MQITRKLIVEQPNFELDFETIQENREAPARLYITGEYIMMNRKNKNRRIYEGVEMLPAIQTFKEEYVAADRAAGELNHCVPDSYKILTDEGWKRLNVISDNEVVATLNVETNEIEYQQIKEKIHAEYSGDMIRIKGRNINLNMTPNHRVPIIKRNGEFVYITAQQLFDDRYESYVTHSYIPKLGEWNVASPQKFILKGISDVKKIRNYDNDITKDIEIDYNVFVSFLGLYLAEGHFTNTRHYGTYITQIKDTYMSQIENLLSKFPPELHWKKTKKGFRCNDRRLSEYVSKLGDCYDKFIPADIKQNSSADDLNDLVFWFNIGDGRFNIVNEKYSVRNVFTVCNTLINDLNECLFKSGNSGNISIIDQKESTSRGRIIKPTRPLFLLNLSKTKGVYLDTRFITIEKETYSGHVGCVTTENSNWYCMDDDGKTYWTGNSDKPDMDLERLAHKIVSLERSTTNPDFFIGKSMVLSSPFGKILESYIRDGLKFGMSTKCLGQIVENSDGNKVKSPVILGVDAVYDPSVSTAFVNGILENREYIIGDDGKIAEAYTQLDKNLASFPSHHRDAIDAYIIENFKKFLASI